VPRVSLFVAFSRSRLHPISATAQIELTYKAFETDEHAKEYFWRFWGIHSHSILPSSVYVDVSQKLPSVGDEHRALYYNPGLMMHSPGDNTFQAAHMLYFNRVGRTVMVLSISGT